MNGFLRLNKVFFGVLLLAVAIWVLGRVLPETIYLIAWAILLGVYAVVLGAFEAAQTNKQRIIKGMALLMFIVSATLIFNALSGSEQSSPQVTTNATATSKQTYEQTKTSNFFHVISEKN